MYSSLFAGTNFNKRRLFQICILATFAVALNSLAFGQSVKTGQFEFKQWDGPPLNVYYAEPENLTSEAPIVIVMHGARRNADDYRDNWIDLAQKYGLRVYAPEFDKKRFPKSRDYQAGGLTKKKEKAFTAIEPLFDAVTERSNSTQDQYYIFGHSAGGQFVHRFAFFGESKRMKYALAANSGWYTLPTKAAEWPYGLAKLKSERYDQENILRAPLVILLGDQDVDSQSHNLRQTPEAQAQGPNRYTRGVYFLKTGLRISKSRGLKSGWGFKIVRGVAHDNKGMAVEAAAMIDAFHKQE